MSGGETNQLSKGRNRAFGVVLAACMILVVFWEIMAGRSSRGFGAFQLTATDFQDFHVKAPGWTVRTIRLSSDPVEPNIVAFALTPKPIAKADVFVGDRVMVRLAHGYNMPECMRIKGKKVVEELPEVAVGKQPAAGDEFSAIQVWRVADSAGGEAIWVTSVLRASDFGGTNVDVRSFAFPRVGVPDEPGWDFRGITPDSLRHPWAGIRTFLRGKWNAARCDLATFLRLKTPAWVSEELLTLVSASGTINADYDAAAATRDALSAHQVISLQLRDFRPATGAGRRR